MKPCYYSSWTTCFHIGLILNNRDDKDAIRLSFSITKLVDNNGRRPRCQSIDESKNAEGKPPAGGSPRYTEDRRHYNADKAVRSRAFVVSHEMPGRTLASMQEREDNNLAGILVNEIVEKVASRPFTVDVPAKASRRTRIHRIEGRIAVQGLKCNLVRIEQANRRTRSGANLRNVSHRAHNALVCTRSDSNAIAHISPESLRGTQTHLSSHREEPLRIPSPARRAHPRSSQAQAHRNQRVA